jgi:predicted SAM-dependent methyltransferase
MKVDRLEIGSGRKPLKGFKTIDIEAYANPDYLGDFRTMCFEDVDEIQSHHLLEHFSRDESIKVLKLWHSWLRPGGKLVVEVPDFEEICNRFISDENEVHKYWLCRHAYGSQEAPWAFHLDGYWEKKLVKMLEEEVGFVVDVVRRRDTRVYLPNLIVEATRI